MKAKTISPILFMNGQVHFQWIQFYLRDAICFDSPAWFRSLKMKPRFQMKVIARILLLLTRKIKSSDFFRYHIIFMLNANISSNRGGKYTNGNWYPRDGKKMCISKKALRVAADYDGKGLSKPIIKWIFTYLTETESNFKVLRSVFLKSELDFLWIIND